MEDLKNIAGEIKTLKKQENTGRMTAYVFTVLYLAVETFVLTTMLPMSYTGYLPYDIMFYYASPALGYSVAAYMAYQVFTKNSSASNRLFYILSWVGLAHILVAAMMTGAYYFLGYTHSEVFIMLFVQATIQEYIPSLLIFIPALSFFKASTMLAQKSQKLVTIVLENRENLL